MILVIGEILIDRFPGYERIGGAPFNFAFHLKQMGLPVRFLTRIGQDEYGRQILRMLQDKGFRSEDIQTDAHHPTGRVDVSLDPEGVPQFNICNDMAYDYLDLSSTADSELSSVQMIYFGTLVQRSTHGYRQIQQFLERTSPPTRLFCDINLRPPHIRAEAIGSSLHHADLLKLNLDELTQISKVNNGPHQEAEAIDWLMQSFGISQIALTLGDRGSKIATAHQTIASQPPQNVPIVDTVGAGDAYASVFAAGYLKHLSVQLTLELATDFAAHICGQAGAVPSDDAFYRILRRKMNA